MSVLRSRTSSLRRHATSYPYTEQGFPRLFLTHPQWDVALCKPVQEDAHVGGAFIVFWGPGSDFPLVKE